VEEEAPALAGEFPSRCVEIPDETSIGLVGTNCDWEDSRGFPPSNGSLVGG